MPLKQGDIVRVNIPEEYINTDPIRKFNGGEYKISSIKGKNGRIYELEGVVSSRGVPFSFVGEWLIK